MTFGVTEEEGMTAVTLGQMFDVDNQWYSAAVQQALANRLWQKLPRNSLT